MKPYGKHKRRPYPNLAGHQNCGICYDNSKPPSKKRARQLQKKELKKLDKDKEDT